MAVMDEFKEEREKLKSQSFKKKLSYFWTYYKWYVIGGLFIAVILTATVRSFLTRTEDALYGVVVNGYASDNEEAFLTGFTDYAGIDTKEYSVAFNSTMRISDRLDESTLAASQFIMVYTSAGDLDVAVMDAQPFTKYAYSGIYSDLSTLLDSELLSSLSGRIYYMDYAVYKQITELEENNQSSDEVIRPDPLKPEEMQEPVPVGIDLTGCSKFMDTYYYESGTAYLGIVGNSAHKDTAVKFIEYIFSE